MTIATNKGNVAVIMGTGQNYNRHRHLIRKAEKTEQPTRTDTKVHRKTREAAANHHTYAHCLWNSNATSSQIKKFLVSTASKTFTQGSDPSFTLHNFILEQFWKCHQLS
jgi:hypothetical protein